MEIPVNNTDACKQCALLYAYFLKICENYSLHKLKQKLKVSDLTGQEIYKGLKKTLVHKYESKIRSASYFSDNQKEALLYPGHIENTTVLDCVMIIRIMRLLERDQLERLSNYVNSIRNFLCHIAMGHLGENVKQTFFNDIRKEMKDEPEATFGIGMNLLETYKENIFS